MALVPNEVKQAIAYLRSIDKSLGRIAVALESQIPKEKEDEPLVWHPGYTSVGKESKDE